MSILSIFEIVFWTGRFFSRVILKKAKGDETTKKHISKDNEKKDSKKKYSVKEKNKVDSKMPEVTM